MENTIKKSGSVEIPKRNRSLDLKSLYESRSSEARNSKKKISDENNQEDIKSKKRKSRKEVPLSCFQSDAKKSRKENVNGVDSELVSRQKSNERSEGLHSISLALRNNGSSFNIPKRPRGSVGRRKVESDQGSERTGLPNSDDSAGACKAAVIKSEEGVGPSDRLVQEATVSSSNDRAPNIKSTKKVNGPNSKLKQKPNTKSTLKSRGSNAKLKRKVGADEVKENRNGQSGSAHNVVKANNQVVNNGDTLSKKRQSNSRKKKDLVVGKEGDDASIKKSEPSGPSVGSSSDRLFVGFVDDDDDDEENLERNAARMLSSRFDPSCTGFSSKGKSSASQKAEGISFPASSRRDSFSRQSKFGGEQFLSTDDKIRKLRPRRENEGKGVPRKRRHFYDIVAQNLDPYWVFNRRIKIFWPLDKSWYYGLVNDYNSETKHHHIKYDDREEEWVDLQDEKFKLLLLPSEVPNKPKARKRSRDEDLHRGQQVPSADNDSCIGDPLDSEPIASWLASQSQRFKTLPKSLKRRRTSQRHLPSVSSLSSEKTDISNTDVVDSKLIRDNPDCESASRDSLLFCGTGNNSLQGNTSTSQSYHHLVYVRKKFRKTGEGDGSAFNGFKARESGPWTVTHHASVNASPLPTKGDKFCCGSLDSGKRLWSFDDIGKLILNDAMLELEELEFWTCVPAVLPLEFLCEIGIFRLLHDIFMLEHGVLMTTSPAVILEMLLIDSNFGLRFLLFEGCLKQALAFVFEILIVFSESEKKWNGDMKLPVTSIRFQFSGFQDPRKQHVFAFYSFSRLKNSKWLILDSMILQRCLLIKQLPVSECTYDNIKKLECGSYQLCKSQVGLKLSPNQCVKKKIIPGILSMGVSQEACNTRIVQPAFCLAARPGKVPQFALSFSAAPTFFLSLHLQILMERSFAWVNLQHQDALCFPGSSGNDGQPDSECAQVEPNSVTVQDGTARNDVRKLVNKASASSGLSSSKQGLGLDIFLASNAAATTNSSEKIQEENPESDRRSGCLKELTEIAPEFVAQSYQCEPKIKVYQRIDVSVPTSVRTSLAPQTSNPRSDSTPRGMMIEIPSSEQVNLPSDGKVCMSRQTSDVILNVDDGFVHKSNPIGSRSSWQHGAGSSISSPLGHHSPVWPDGKPNFTPNGFGNGPKKPRTQVQYTLPFVGYDLSEKPKTPSSRSLPCKRIRRASLKGIPDGSGNNQKNVESLTCVANVLVTHGDKGWREYGAHIVLEVADHNEWKLAVKLSGVTKYSFKVKHILQPGTTNRYSHAMMWKGGKDWVLEFPDRSQWMIFKEMHEECHDRNIRAASVKNIPIPGVRVVEESDDYGTDVPFIRNPMKYFRQVQTDVEMAMDPSHILYDMDSDDEKLLMEHNNTEKLEEISEEFFEKAMDMFEKVSYSQLRDNFTDDEIEELVVGLGSGGAAKVVYEHWRRKREKMGMPLIRHLQPPLWERYQQQVKEWEHNVARGNYAFSVGSREKVPLPEKPPMFAFCLKPRGLEVPNKGSKQRSHRKLPVSGHHHASSVDHDGLVFGRRSNGHVFGDDKMLYTSSIHHDFSDVSPSFRASTRVLSPRDSHFALTSGVSDWKRNPKLYKSKKSKKLVPYPSFQNQQTMSYNQRPIGKGNGVQQWPDFSTQRRYYIERPYRQGAEQLDGSDINEFRLRDASGAAQHALNMAKFKRERAQRLLYSADIAVHKAVVAIMTAEAIKDSYGNPNGITSNHQ